MDVVGALAGTLPSVVVAVAGFDGVVSALPKLKDGKLGQS